MASKCSGGGGTVLASGIRTRERKERKLYSDDWALGDEEIEGHHTFDLQEKMTTDKFNMCMVKDMTEVDFDLGYMQKNGFNWPLLFREKKKLGIEVPGSDFSINDVRQCVGSRRMLDVMDVNTQKNVEMTMKDWQRYFESKDKDKLLNVISLEFSHTKLESLVHAPEVVRQIDWVERVWPRHLKEAQTESTNVLEDMMYPKVQKYCLMSVSGCYTDFHIDFGGTSVWYHVLRGKKIFWLIPPTERNLQLYEQWVLSGKQSDIFFGDTVEKCARVELKAGYTFFIPTGWIHAVYTPEDSLVFGGNFLHSFGIEKQLRVAQVEDTTHVPQKFRYPFFTEMLWYVLERYVHVLLGRTHLTLPDEEEYKYQKYSDDKAKQNNNDTVKEETDESKEIKEEKDKDKVENNEVVKSEEEKHVHLTQFELHGLKAIVMYLHALPTSKKCVPELIHDPIALIRDVRTVVERHRYDTADMAITSKPVLEWWEREPIKYGLKRQLVDRTELEIVKKRKWQKKTPSDSNVIQGPPPNINKSKRRRVRCKQCKACVQDDCRECNFCQDMVKYGGAGVMKQTCKEKKCAQPSLPAKAACYLCDRDGWGRVISTMMEKPPVKKESNLMECCVCFQISHQKCIAKEYETEGIVNEDLPNCWECPECVNLGYNKTYQHSRMTSGSWYSSSDNGGKTPKVLSEAEGADTKVKQENGHGTEGDKSIALKKIAMLTDNLEGPLRMPTWEQLQARVSYPLVRPMWVVRPDAPPPFEEEEEEEVEELESGSDGESRPKSKEVQPPTMQRSIMLSVFRNLSVNDLKAVMQVCRSWAQWAITPSLWPSIALKHKRIDVPQLQGIVRRQPKALNLSWGKISYEQLSWLLARLPQLQELQLEGLEGRILSALSSPYCPALTSLNLSYCEGLTDQFLGVLLSPPRTHRPGHRDLSTRLRHLKHLRLAGTQVGDQGVRAIVHSLPFLQTLDLSSCVRVTEITPALLSHSSSVLSHSLSSLDLRGCHRLAPFALPSLSCMPTLTRLAIHPCEQIPLPAIKVWGKSNGYNLDKDNILTRDPKPLPDLSEDANDSLFDIENHPSPQKPPPPPEVIAKINKIRELQKQNKEMLEKENMVKTGKGPGRRGRAAKNSKAQSKSTKGKKPNGTKKSKNGKGKAKGAKPDQEEKIDKRLRTNKNKIIIDDNKKKEIQDIKEVQVKKPDVKPIKSRLDIETAKTMKEVKIKLKDIKNTKEGKALREAKTDKEIQSINIKLESSSSPKIKEIKKDVIETKEEKEKKIVKDTKEFKQDKGKKKHTDSKEIKKPKDIDKSKKTVKDSVDKIEKEKISKIQKSNDDGRINKIQKKNEGKITIQAEKIEQKSSIKKCKLDEKKISGTNKVTNTETSESFSSENQKDLEQEENPRVSTRRKSRVQDGEGELKEKYSPQESVSVSEADISNSSNTPCLSEKKKEEKNGKEIEEKAKHNDKIEEKNNKEKEEKVKHTESIKRKEIEKKVKHNDKIEEKNIKEKEEKVKLIENIKGQDTQKMKKNLIITSVEVHQSDSSDGKKGNGSAKRIERRQSLRKSKDEQELRNEEKKGAQDGRDSPKDKKIIKDTKSKDIEMNKITIEDDVQAKKLDEKKILNISKKQGEKQTSTDSSKIKPEKDVVLQSKKTDEKKILSINKRQGEKQTDIDSPKVKQEKDVFLQSKKTDEKKILSINKRQGEKQTDIDSSKAKQEKDIVTRSTKKLKGDKGADEKSCENTDKVDEKTKIICTEMTKLPKIDKDIKEKDVLKSKELAKLPKIDKDIKEKDVPKSKELETFKSPKTGIVRRERDPETGRMGEKKEEDVRPAIKKPRLDLDGSYMKKLRRKSHDSDGSLDSSASDSNKKEETKEDKVRVKLRRSTKDEDLSSPSPDIKIKSEAQKKIKSPDDASEAKIGKNEDDQENGTTITKVKEESGDDKNVEKAEGIQERSGSRERPERSHRSPRRLSLCQ